MRPLTFITGVLLGSAGALSCVLGLIVFFRWVLASDPSLDQTVVQSDLPLGELLQDMAIFTGLALLALAGFLGELRLKPWRWAADGALATALVAVILFFFADPSGRLRDFGILGLAAVLAALGFSVAGRLGLVSRVVAWLGD